MGITGLLPALKSIQVVKHLKDYIGQSVAVDGYVWLHRGVCACATELATGKKTRKYVDYAMHRVRLLRHYGIKPYIVFDGGLLPAKKGTEYERRQKREENLARGNALSAQGKHSQARECYLKAVDVSPQMAFQFIKALRAESVDYVVAPYEADAQLAYLERAGLVDAIITEDSDLLVFGCQNVLFKLDAVANTVVSISRKDFGSLTTSSDANTISLFGWSDAHFRAMAILSGCDYLPSIPGIGLKTACTLLRKWKSAEQVVRALMMEGKKNVPPGYWKQFQQAEKCYLHQRVYCPIQGKLVHLTEVTGEWSDNDEAYVGSDMDPVLAKQIALGDIDPVTRLPMEDINPGFVPRTLKPLPLSADSASRSPKIRSKGRASPTTGGILRFFDPIPTLQTKQNTPPVVIKPSLSGKASGKKRLAEIMDQDIAQKKKLRKSSSPSRGIQSKFFHTLSESKTSGVQRRHSDGVIAAGSSKLEDKENVYIVVDDDDDDEVAETSEPDVDGSDLSLKAQFDHDADMDLHVDEFPDVVEQEDGYISPTSSCSKDLQDLSSPLRSGQTPARRKWKSDQGLQSDDLAMIQSDEDAYFGVEAVSSPVSIVKRHVSPFIGRGFVQYTPTKRNINDDDEGDGRILVHATPSPTKVQSPADEIPSPILYYGPDLREAFAFATDDAEEGKTKRISHESMVLNQCTPGSGSSRIANFKRSNTNVTPRGRHALSSVSRYPRSAPSKMPVGGIKLMNAKERLAMFRYQMR